MKNSDLCIAARIALGWRFQPCVPSVVVNARSIVEACLQVTRLCARHAVN
jgi:hypothetical protein